MEQIMRKVRIIIFFSLLIGLAFTRQAFPAIEEPKESPEDKQVILLLEKAQSYYQDSLRTCDETFVYKSAETLEELINKYPEAVGTPDAYFTLAELLSSKIQGDDACKAAIIAYEDYIRRFPWMEKAWEADYNIASIYYLYLKDYNSARTAIEKLFEDYESALTRSDDDMKKAKLLYAKIMHKCGELDKELQALQEIEFLDQKMAFGFQARLLRGIKPNRIKNDKDDKFIFMGTFDPEFPVNQLIFKFRQAEENVKKLLPGIDRDFPLEIFVYQDSQFFDDTTDREGSFGSGGDSQIFYLDAQPITPLFAQIYDFILNNQPSSLKIDFFETGFINAFERTDLNTDVAALQMGISEEEFVPEKLFVNNEFAFLGEKDAISAVFVNYLLKNYPPQNFYRIFKMLEGGLELGIIKDGIKNVYGVDFDTLRSDFIKVLADRRAELDRKLDQYWVANPPGKLKIDQSSPEAALTSYFEALKAGNYEDFMKLSTGELHNTLEEAYKIYKEKNILEKVERWRMAIPYMDYKVEVTTTQSIRDDLAVFGVNLLRDGVVMERKSLAALRKNGKWYIAQN